MPNVPSSPQWYLVQSRSREEIRALENLERQGFHCYCPMASMEKRRHGRKVWLREAFFPSYLFIRLDEIRDNWSLIRSTRGVLQLVRFGEYPVPVAEEIIEAIRRRLARESALGTYLKSGDRVLITEGAFAQLEAIFLTNDGAERVVLLMEILQTEHAVSFPMRSVEKLRAS